MPSLGVLAEGYYIIVQKRVKHKGTPTPISRKITGRKLSFTDEICHEMFPSTSKLLESKNETNRDAKIPHSAPCKTLL
jgi:hypothetical protein